MAEKGKGLSDEALGALVDKKIESSVKWVDSTLSKEREKVLRYYQGQLPARQKEASSSYVSTEVYDSVESMTAQLLETFSAGREICKFEPTGPEDVEPARIATAYTDHVVFSQNKGYDIFGQVIRDGLMARVGLVKVYWCEDFQDIEEEFSEVPEEAVMMLAAEDSVQNLNAEQDLVTGAFSGKFTRRRDYSYVKIEPINPEEFGIEEGAKELSKDWFCVHRTIQHIDELVKMGFKRSEIEEAGRSVKTNPYGDFSTERDVRSQLQSGWKGRHEEDDDWYEVNECYLTVRLKGDDYAKYRKIIRIGDKNFDVQEVDDHPFVAFVPLPIPHAFYGNNFAARVIPAQNIRTSLTRAIVDHAAITTNPRYQVLKGGLTNPRELLDNRLGGLVNVTRPDAITPLDQAPLNPFVFQTLELIKSQNEETTGMSSLSQGLNKDAVSKQNSDAMIERLVGLSQTRQKIIARNFANGFLIPLYIKVYNLVILKEDKKKVVELTGNWVEINPVEWIERRAATVSLHLGYREHDREADKLVQTGALLNQDPRLQRMFTDENRYKLAVDVMKLQGHGNYQDYITPPSELPPEQPDPMMMAKMEIEKMKAEAALLNAQATMKKVDLYGQIELSRKEDTQRQQEIDNIFREHEEMRKDLDVANKVEIAHREMTLAEETAVEEAKMTAVVSPR